MLRLLSVWSEELYPHLDLVPYQDGELSKITNIAPWTILSTLVCPNTHNIPVQYMGVPFPF